MPSLGSLIAKVSLDYAEFELGADRSSQAALKMGNDIERAVTKALGTYKKSVGDMSAANDSLGDSMSRATAGAAALAETEEQAAARIRDMVARSREAQDAMNDAASAASTAATSTAALGASADQVRTTVAAQTQAMADANRASAMMNDEMQALRTTAAQGNATFETLGEQYVRLDRAMATGKLSMQEYDATLGALGKDEDRRLQQLNALTARYDPLGTASRKLAADQQLLDDAYKTGQITAEQYQQALAGIKADQAGVQLRSLAQDEAQLERAFKSGQVSASDYKKSLADINSNRTALKEIADGANSGAAAMEGFGLKTAGARKEVVVLAHEALTGSWSNFGGSLMVLAERMDLLEAATSSTVLAVAAIAAPIVLVGAAMVEVANQTSAMNEALVMTGDYAGVTVSGLHDMAQAATAGGATFNTAADAVTQLAATGKLTGSEIAQLGQTTADVATYTSMSVKQMVDEFTKLAEDPVKASVKLNDTYHYLTESTYDQITALEKQGDATGAAQVAVEAFSKEMESRTQDIAKNQGVILQGWREIKSMINQAVEAVGKFGAEADPARDLQFWQSAKQRAQAGIGASWTDEDEASLQKAQAAYQAAKKQAEDKARADREAQEKIDAKHSYDVWNAQFATPAEKRMKEINTYVDTIATPLGLSPEQQLADEQKINDKYKDKSTSSRSTGLIDKTQLQGDVQAIKDALAEQLAAVSSSQKQLDALYKSGGLSMSDYYTQSRELVMQKASDEADAYNKEAAILEKGLKNQKLSASQRAQIINQIADLHAKASKAIEGGMNGVAQSAAEEDAVWAKYGEDSSAAIRKQIDAANQQDQSLKDQIDTFGMGKAAIDELKASRADDTVAALEQGRAIAILQNNIADTTPWDTAIEEAKKLAAALHGVASDQAVLDQKEAAKKVADQAVQDWKSASNSIENGITNALMNGFNNGKSLGQQLADSLKSMFKTLILQPIIAPVAGATASLMYPGAAQAYAQTNPNSPLVSLTSSGGLYSSANGLISSASRLFGGMSTGTAANIANAEGGDTLGNFLSLTGNAGTGAGTAGNAFSSVSSFLGAAGTGYGVGSIVGNLFGGGTAGTGSQVGGTVGGVAGSFIPIPGGTLIGSAIGSALGGLVGSLFGGGETRSGATYTTDGTTATKVGTGPSGGDPASEQVTSQINSTFQTIQSMATSLGGSIADLGTYHAGYEVSPKKGNSFVTAGFTTDPNEWDPGREDLGGVKDATTVLNDLSLQLQRSVIKSLQDANLDKPYADYLKQFDASSLSSDQVTQIEATLNELKSLFDAIQTMGSDFDNLKNASTDAQLAVVNLSGGVDQFSTNASYFEQNFVPAAEQTANQAKAVTDQLSALGMSSVTTNDQFRQAVEGIDLSTAAGQQLYAQMLALAPAFNTMTQAAAAAQQAAQQAADQQQSLWDNYYGALYTSDQQLSVSQGQLKAKFDALGVAMPQTNADFEALVENMDTSTQPMKDLQNALLGLAPAFGQVTSAADQAAQAAAQAQQEAAQAQQQAVQTALSNVQTAYDNQVQAIQSNITSINQFIASLTGLKQSLALGDLSTLSPQQKYLQEKQLFEQTSSAAASGDATAQGNLPQVAQDFLNASKAYNASSQAYVDDFNAVQAALDTNISAAQQQLSVAQRQLDATNQMVKGILDLNQTAMTLEEALQQYFAAGGTSSSASGSGAGGGGASLSPGGDASTPYVTPDWVKAAMGMTIGPNGTYGWYSSPVSSSTSSGDASSSSGASAGASGGGGTSAGSSASGGAPTDSAAPSDAQSSAAQGQIESLYEQVLGRQADAGGLQFYTDQVNSGQKTLDQVQADLQYAKLTGAYADGGFAPAGLALVGENGPEIVDFKSPGRVYTNSDLGQALNPIDYSKFGKSDTAALVGHIKTLNDKIAQLQSTVAAVGTAQIQQSQQQHAENRADMSRQTRQLQAVGDNTGKIANNR